MFIYVQKVIYGRTDGQPKNSSEFHNKDNIKYRKLFLVFGYGFE